MGFDVSVIIPTYQGEHKIGLLLNALANQTFKDFQLIIAIDGSTDNSELIINPFRTVFENLKVIRQENKGRAAIRNFGARQADGSLFIFYDDDMRPVAESLKKHVVFHNQHVGILNGLPIDSMVDTDIQRYKASRSKGWMNRFNDGLTKLDSSNLFFTAANCSFSKEVFFSLRGFDENLSDAEDFEFGFRALKEGHVVFFDKSNMALHEDPITCKSYIKRQRDYTLAHRTLVKLHPDLPATDQKRISFFRSFAYSVLRASLFVKLIDHFNIFLLLPISIRYKLYDAIIWAHAKSQK